MAKIDYSYNSKRNCTPYENSTDTIVLRININITIIA